MAATEAPATPPVEEVLSREAERGPRIGAASIAAGVLVLLGAILLQLVYADVPRVAFTDALRDAAGQDIGREGLLTDKILFYDEKSAQLIGVSLLQGLGALLAGLTLAWLADSARARGSGLPRFAKINALFGGVAAAIGAVALQVTAAVLSGDFAGQEDQGTAAAHDALRSGVLVAMQFVQFVGMLSLALAFVLIALNAMKVGLLTRFMGILGALVGALVIIPLGSPIPVVQGFWLVAFGMLLLGRWPGGAPPAWQTGRAMPWPTQQELREARERAKAGGAGAARTTSAEPEPEQPRTGAPSPAASKKKKRKRRG